MFGLNVLVPVAKRADKNRFRPADRVPDLRGKTVGLYDNCKPGGGVAQDRLASRLAARYEGITFSRLTGTMGGRSTLTADAAREIVDACDAVIGIRAD